jgi:hypothetical protein
MSKIDATLALSCRNGFAGDDPGGKHSWYDSVGLGVIPVHELLELRVQEISAELELLHFLEGLISGPLVMRDAIGRSHHTGAMPSASAVDVNRLIRGIVHKLQE